METATISLFISGFVASLTMLKFFGGVLARKEASEDKFAKVSFVSNEFLTIKNDIVSIEEELEEHREKINSLQTQSAVISSQLSMQLREVEKLGDKIDELER